MRFVLIIGLLFTLVAGACSQSAESKSVTVENGVDHLVRVNVEFNTQPDITLLLEPGQTDSFPVAKTPFTLVACLAYSGGNAIVSSDCFFQQEYTLQQIEEAQFHITLQ